MMRKDGGQVQVNQLLGGIEHRVRQREQRVELSLLQFSDLGGRSKHVELLGGGFSHGGSFAQRDQ